MNILQPPGWPRPRGYANGIGVSGGRTIYTAGMIGWDEKEMIVSHRLDLQFEQALKNIVAVLAEGGAEPAHIVRMTVYITDRAQYLRLRDELAPIWKRVIGNHYPAMALVEVKALVNSSANVEIEATAVVPE